MKIGITGASGMLGTELLSRLSKTHKIFATSRSKGFEGQNIEWSCFDLTDANFLNNWLEASQPDLVIHCAAIVNVDEYTSVEQIKQVNNELINCDYFSGILYSPWVSIKELNKDHDIKTIFKNLFQDANNQFS